MTVAHAAALLPAQPAQPVIVEHRPAEDAAALKRLARWATQFTPLAAADAPDGLVLDLTGCGRLYGSLRRTAEQVHVAVVALGFAARVGVARTAGAAWGVARYAPAAAGDVVLAVRKPPDKALASLPAAALRIDDAVVATLAEVGIQTVGELLNVPRADLAQRFGPELLARIDVALGRVPDVFDAEKTPAPPAVAYRYAGPTLQAEAIEKTVRQLVERLCDELSRREAGARRVALVIERLDAEFKPEFDRKTVGFSRPSRDARHLWATLRPTVENLHLGQGVERLELMATSIANLQHAQIHTDGRAEATDVAARQEGELVDRLLASLGPGRVLRAAVVESHVPEAAFTFYRADEPPPLPTDAAVTAGDRPVALLDPPEPAEVSLMNPEGPVITLHWRGTRRHVIASVGPERIGRRWWHFAPTPHTLDVRDYYRLKTDDGVWAWAYRTLPSGRWFIQGVWA